MSAKSNTGIRDTIVLKFALLTHWFSNEHVQVHSGLHTILIFMAALAGPFLASPDHHLHFLPHHSAPLQPREQFLRLNAARGRQTRDHDKGRVEKEIKGNEEIIWSEMPVYAPGSRSFQHRAFQFLSPPHTHSALSLFDVQFFFFF